MQQNITHLRMHHRLDHELIIETDSWRTLRGRIKNNMSLHCCPVKLLHRMHQHVLNIACRFSIHITGTSSAWFIWKYSSTNLVNSSYCPLTCKENSKLQNLFVANEWDYPKQLSLHLLGRVTTNLPNSFQKCLASKGFITLFSSTNHTGSLKLHFSTFQNLFSPSPNDTDDTQHVSPSLGTPVIGMGPINTHPNIVVSVMDNPDDPVLRPWRMTLSEI